MAATVAAAVVAMGEGMAIDLGAGSAVATTRPGAPSAAVPVPSATAAASDVRGGGEAWPAAGADGGDGQLVFTGLELHPGGRARPAGVAIGQIGLGRNPARQPDLPGQAARVHGARGTEADIVHSLDAGADDYVVKPYGGAQLDARIRAVLRRATGPAEDPVIEVGGLRVDRRARQASLDGAGLDLTPREFDLLHYLAARAGTVVTKHELLVEVWQLPYGGADKSLDVHLSWLRRKLGESAEEPRYLHTVRRVGVRLDAPAEPGPG
jgi:DNA-binding winged helix-turn-helix (wHTH) protein